MVVSNLQPLKRIRTLHIEGYQAPYTSPASQLPLWPSQANKNLVYASVYTSLYYHIHKEVREFVTIPLYPRP